MKKLFMMMILFPLFFASTTFSQENSDSPDSLIFPPPDSLEENFGVITPEENLVDSVRRDRRRHRDRQRSRRNRDRSNQIYRFNVVDYNTTEISADRSVFIKCHDRLEREIKNRIPGVTFRDLENFRQRVTRLTQKSTRRQPFPLPLNLFLPQKYEVTGYVHTISPTVQEIGWACSATFQPSIRIVFPERVTITSFMTTLDPL